MTFSSGIEVSRAIGVTRRSLTNFRLLGMPYASLSKRRFGYSLPDVITWYADYQARLARELEERKEVTRTRLLNARVRYCRHCHTGPLVGWKSLCDSCRSMVHSIAAKSAKKRTLPPKEPPAWTKRAQQLYEEGNESSTVARNCRVSLASVNAWMRRQGWDRGRNLANRDRIRFPNLDTLREAYESGEPPIGMKEGAFRSLAHRQDWDDRKRWDAIQTKRREGMDKATRDKLRAKVRKQARRANSDGTVTPALISELHRDPLCPYCSRPITSENRSLDHVEPVSAGGAESAQNLVTCCISCNISKSDRPLLLWLAWRAARQVA